MKYKDRIRSWKETCAQNKAGKYKLNFWQQKIQWIWYKGKQAGNPIVYESFWFEKGLNTAPRPQEFILLGTDNKFTAYRANDTIYSEYDGKYWHHRSQY